MYVKRTLGSVKTCEPSSPLLREGITPSLQPALLDMSSLVSQIFYMTVNRIIMYLQLQYTIVTVEVSIKKI